MGGNFLVLVEEFDAVVPPDFITSIQGFIKATESGCTMTMDPNSEGDVEVTTKVVESLLSSWKRCEDSAVKFSKAEGEVRRLADCAGESLAEGGRYAQALGVLSAYQLDQSSLALI
jgi:hypothetical protein